VEVLVGAGVLVGTVEVGVDVGFTADVGEGEGKEPGEGEGEGEGVDSEYISKGP